MPQHRSDGMAPHASNLQSLPPPHLSESMQAVRSAVWGSTLTSVGQYTHLCGVVCLVVLRLGVGPPQGAEWPQP